MISFPNAKINLGLKIVRKRPDGFHDLETVFYPVGWKDALEVIPGNRGAFQLTTSGLTIDSDPEKNLCYKAWKLLSTHYKLPPLQAHLHKVIPMGAGLGGGSADAAFMLELINRTCSLNLQEKVLLEMASELGSDCPFFIRNKPAFATGRGEILSAFPEVLKGYHIVILMPDVFVNTAEAYSWICPSEEGESIRDILKLPVSEWKNRLLNDFEKPVSHRYPVIAEAIETLYQRGAIYSAMSGSGAAVFGIFNEVVSLDIPEVNFWQGSM